MTDVLTPRLTSDELNRRITDKQFSIGRCIRALKDFVLAYESCAEPEAMDAVYGEALVAIEENDKVFDPTYVPPPRVALSGKGDDPDRDWMPTDEGDK